MHSSRGTTSLRVWQCGALDRLFSTYLCKYFVTLPIYHLHFFATEWENYNRYHPACWHGLRLLIFIFAVKSREGLWEWWELIMHFIGMMDTARSTQTYISPENREESAWSSVTPLRNAVSSHSQKMKLRWHKIEKQWYDFPTAAAGVGGFTFSQLEILTSCRQISRRCIIIVTKEVNRLQKIEKNNITTFVTVTH